MWVAGGMLVTRPKPAARCSQAPAEVNSSTALSSPALISSLRSSLSRLLSRSATCSARSWQASMAACSRISGIMLSVTAYAPRPRRHSGMSPARNGGCPPANRSASRPADDLDGLRDPARLAGFADEHGHSAGGLAGGIRAPLPSGHVAVLGLGRLAPPAELGDLGGVAPAPANARRCGRSPRR